MRIPGLAAAVVTAFLTTPAMAFHCPLDVAAIDHALATVQLDDGTRDEVSKLRDEGQALHDSGQHQEAVNTLAQAMRLLLNAL